jgi:hypothetical protein
MRRAWAVEPAMIEGSFHKLSAENACGGRRRPRMGQLV